MTDYFKLKLEYARLSGEFIGTLQAVLWYDIPEDLKIKLIEIKDQISERCDKILKEDESTED